MNKGDRKPSFFKRSYSNLAANRLGKHAQAAALVSVLTISFSLFVVPQFVYSGGNFHPHLVSVVVMALFIAAIFCIPVSYAMGILLNDLYGHRPRLSLVGFLKTLLINSIPSVLLMVVGTIASLLLASQEPLALALFGLGWIGIKAIGAAIGYAVLLGGTAQ